VGLFRLFFIKGRRIKTSITILLLPAVINLAIVVQWATQGGYYGYRYIFFSLAPLLLYPLADGLQQINHQKRKTALILIVILALFPIASLICFEGNDTDLTQHSIDQYFGRAGWGNNTYQLEVWQTILKQPKEFLIIVAKGGPLYLVYVAANAARSTHLLPDVVLKKYPSFSLVTLVRVIIIYALPFFLNFFFVRKKSKGNLLAVLESA